MKILFLHGCLLALRPAALVMLCGHAAGRFKRGDTVVVAVTSIDKVQGQVKVELRHEVWNGERRP